MRTDYTAWWFWLNVGQMLATGVIGVYVWWINRERVTTKRFDEHAQRLAKVETAVDHPHCLYHCSIEARLDALHGDIREITGWLTGLRRAVDLMNEYLINRGGKG